MAGTTIPLVNKQEFDFTNGDTDYVVVKAVPVEQYTEGTLYVRVHSNDIDSGTGQIDVKGYTTAPSGEEPDTDFNVATAAVTATVDESSVDTAPKLKSGALSANFGSHLQIKVEGTLGTSTTCKATISVDLALKA